MNKSQRKRKNHAAFFTDSGMSVRNGLDPEVQYDRKEAFLSGYVVAKRNRLKPETVKKQDAKSRFEMALSRHGGKVFVETLSNDRRSVRKEVCESMGISMKQYRKAEKVSRRQANG